MLTATRKTKPVKTGGFGFDPEESAHHFLVYVPRAMSQPVEISEHHSWTPEHGSSEVSFADRADGQLRVSLSRVKWDRLADDVRAHFNARLKLLGRPAGTWRAGANLVRREFGKELVLLTWALEDADPSLAPIAVANWLGLEPEERWWLYTQTAAATGDARDRGRGWRKAVRFALTENPAMTRAPTDRVVPEFFRQAKQQAALFEPGEDTE